MSAHIKALLGVAFAALVIGGVYFYFASGPEAPVGPPIELVDKMKLEGVPAIQTKDLDGKDFDLASLGQKILIINFWASWCEPCIEEVPSLLSLIDKLKGKAVLIAISGDSDRIEIDSFLKSFPGMKRSGVHLLWDESKAIMDAYGVERLPETFIVGPDMKLVRKVVGSVRWDHDESVKYFEKIAQDHSL